MKKGNVKDNINLGIVVNSRNEVLLIRRVKKKKERINQF